MYIIICEIDHQSKLDAWNRALKADALEQPRGMGWARRWEGVSEWGTHVHPWLMHVNVRQKLPQYFKVVGLQLKLINKLKKENKDHGIQSHYFMANRWWNSGNSDRLYFLGYKITADGDCSHEIKRCLLLGRKAKTNLNSILKSRDITLPTKVCLVKAMVFPVVMYEGESWTIKKAECPQTDAFELWCWKRLLRVPLTSRRSN